MYDAGAEVRGVRERLMVIMEGMEGSGLNFHCDEYASGCMRLLYDLCDKLQEVGEKIEEAERSGSPGDVSDLNLAFKLYQITKAARGEGSAAPSPGTLAALIAHLLAMRDTHGSNIRVLVNGDSIETVEYIEEFIDPNGTVPEDNLPAYVNLNTIG